MASTNMDEHDYAPRRPAPPTEQHILVLLTAFEMFGTDCHFVASDFDQALSPMNYWDIIYCLSDLTDARWVSVSEPVEYEDEYHYFTDEQARAINRHYPNCLDT